MARGCGSHGKSKHKKCMRPGPVTRNAFLNFLRDYRKKHCGLTVVQVAVQGAKCWRCMSPGDKCKYLQMARSAPRRKRRHRKHHKC